MICLYYYSYFKIYMGKIGAKLILITLMFTSIVAVIDKTK